MGDQILGQQPLVAKPVLICGNTLRTGALTAPYVTTTRVRPILTER